MSEEIKKKTFPCRIVLNSCEPFQKSKKDPEQRTLNLSNKCSSNLENKNSLNQHVKEVDKAQDTNEASQNIIKEYQEKKINEENEELLTSNIRYEVKVKSSEIEDKSYESDDSLCDEDIFIQKEKQRKPFSCDECEKRFKYASELKVHSRMHTGERPFVCKTCEKAYTQRSHLNRHMAMHKKSMKKFICPVCKKSFLLKFYLDQHTRTHNNIRPYECDECGSKFIQRSHLNTHKKKHLVIREFKCKFCNRAFILKTHLKQHLLRLHNRKL